MYILALLDTMRFKAVIAINLSKLRNEACLYKISTRMGDLLESLVGRAKSGQYCVVGGGSSQIAHIYEPRM
jgi:hypothetical protein